MTTNLTSPAAAPPTAAEVIDALELAGIRAFPIAIKRDGSGKRPLVMGGHKFEKIDGSFIYVSQPAADEFEWVGWCPGPADLIGIDCDIKHGLPGIETADRLGVPTDVMVGTPSGGQHRLVRKRVKGIEVGNSSPWAADGIDIRADDGWLAWYGSIDSIPDLKNAPLCPEPIWAGLISKRSSSKSVSTVERTPGERITCGRNNYFVSRIADLHNKFDDEATFRIVCHLIGNAEIDFDAELSCDDPTAWMDLRIAAAWKKESTFDRADLVLVGEYVQNLEATQSIDVGVVEELGRQRSWRRARKILDDEEAARVRTPIAPESARRLLERVSDDRRELIQGVHRDGQTELTQAQAKAGKTTLAVAQSMALLDGLPFLGRETDFATDWSILYLNYELDPLDFQDMVRASGLRNVDRLFVDHRRIVAGDLPLHHEDTRGEIAEFCRERGVKAIILDPATNAMQGFPGNQNDNSDVAEFCRFLDALKVEAECPNLIVPHHAGHGDDARARGASHWMAWPDVLWTLTRDGDQRFLRIDGRGRIAVPEFGIGMDASGLLVPVEGNKRDLRERREAEQVMHVAIANPRRPKTEVKAKLRMANGAKDYAINEAERLGFVIVEQVGNSRLVLPNEDHALVQAAMVRDQLRSTVLEP